MKKNLILVAAATMMLGFAACTDEPFVIDPENPVVEGAAVKSVDDLKGTEWTYTMEIEPIEFYEETLDLSMEFGLNFDEEYAHLVFPEEVTFLTCTDEYTLEEIEEMNLAYTYDAATTSGTLTYNDFTLPFTYNEATDAININMGVAFDEEGETAEYFTLVFTRK